VLGAFGDTLRWEALTQRRLLRLHIRDHNPDASESGGKVEIDMMRDGSGGGGGGR
jgi:hypothetical protein